MNKEDERNTYDEFMTMFKFAPRMCYTLYDRAENEIENLQKKVEQGDHYKHLYSEVKKQKDDGIKYIKEHIKYECDDSFNGMQFYSYHLYDFNKEELLRMLGEAE